MLAGVTADIILLLHLAFILYVFFGVLMTLRWHWLAFIHIPMVCWAAVVNHIHTPCPLTPLENYFRKLAGETGYAGGFVEHYITPLVYPDGMSGQFILLVSGVLISWNILIYGMLIYKLLTSKYK